MSIVHSFPPIAPQQPRCLILGSMPGLASLRAQQYYAHPRNAFWPIMQELFGISTAQAYESRCRLLCEQRIAVWDVLKTCTRTGSLDSAIVEDSMVPNDFRGFLQQHPSLSHLFFNGAKAEAVFRRHVAPGLGELLNGVNTRRLPSTSPAHASLDLQAKRREWEAVRACLG